MTRDEWLEARRNSIGASEVAAVLGESPWASPLSVWYDKVHGGQEADKDHLSFGLAMEDAIAGLYRRRTKRQVNALDPYTIEYHKDIPWLSATFDRQVWKDSRPGALELKHVSGFQTKKDEWSFAPPDYYVYQLQTQIAVGDFAWGSLAGVFPGAQLEVYDTVPRPEFLEAAYPHLEKFWKHVLDKTPPAPDGKLPSLDILKRMYPNDSGETVALNEQKWVDLMNERLKLKAKMKQDNDRVKEINAMFKLEMKEATYAVLLDGTQITSRVIKRSGYTVDETSYRSFSVKRSKG